MQDGMVCVMDALNEMVGDNTVPKNIKTKIDTIIKLLSCETEIPIKVSRALHEMEEISEDVNIQPYTRTQLFNVVSLLESVK